jgi:hypothetical protein
LKGVKRNVTKGPRSKSSVCFGGEFISGSTTPSSGLCARRGGLVIWPFVLHRRSPNTLKDSHNQGHRNPTPKAHATSDGVAQSLSFLVPSSLLVLVRQRTPRVGPKAKKSPNSAVSLLVEKNVCVLRVFAQRPTNVSHHSTWTGTAKAVSSPRS